MQCANSCVPQTCLLVRNQGVIRSRLHAVTKQRAVAVSRRDSLNSSPGHEGLEDSGIIIGCQRVDRRRVGTSDSFVFFFKRARVWYTEVGCEDKGGGQQADSADKSGKRAEASRSAAAAQEDDGPTLQSWQP